MTARSAKGVLAIVIQRGYPPMKLLFYHY